MSHPLLSILIVSYNTRDLLADCLRSLRRVADEAPFETIVVDNASSDGSADYVVEQFPEVRLIRLDRNIGFAAAMNEAIEACQGGLFLALNPDAVVPAGTLRKLMDFMVMNPTAAVAGAVLTYADGSLQGSTFRFPSLFREFWNFLPELKAILRPQVTWLKVTDVHKPREPIQVDCVSGAALMARTDAVKQIGGFDGEFFLYHEEMDLCTRLRKAGWEVWSVRQAQVIHLDAKASGYRQNRLPHQPVLGWRIGGMDRLWWKHKSRRQHALWRTQGCALLRLRIALIGGGMLFSQACRDRVHELVKIVKMLHEPADSKRQKAAAKVRRD
ncbi:MAG TPA: glycosyltransferase family 2 protein [bacterium]|jgi:hypothetical protein